VQQQLPRITNSNITLSSLTAKPSSNLPSQHHRTTQHRTPLTSPKLAPPPREQQQLPTLTNSNLILSPPHHHHLVKFQKPTRFQRSQKPELGTQSSFLLPPSNLTSINPKFTSKTHRSRFPPSRTHDKHTQTHLFFELCKDTG